MKNSEIVSEGAVTCFIEDFKTYIEGLGEIFPVP